MSFKVNRIVTRMIKSERDFSFIDKIGNLTNSLIAAIPNTELQRNGQYGALVVLNPVYKFESQITQTETNIAVNTELNIDDERFADFWASIIDINQKISSTIKKITGSTNDLKSIICQVEGMSSEDKNEVVEGFIRENCTNKYAAEGAENRQVSYVWREGNFEKYISISKAETGYKYIFAIQDFNRRDMAFSNIRLVLDYSIREFSDKIIPTIEG